LLGTPSATVVRTVSPSSRAVRKPRSSIVAIRLSLEWNENRSGYLEES
jgi:hypothetical protein